MANHVRSVFLIRHGRTSYNAAHKLQGQVDIPLDAVGEWQVKQTAAALKSLYVDRRPEINHRFIVCSDLKRAHATAQAFADVLGGIEPVDDRRVRERSFGDWDGHAVAELAERYDTFVITDAVVQLPIGPERFVDNDRVTVTVAVFDPDLVGVALSVTSREVKSQATMRRLHVSEVSS